MERARSLGKWDEETAAQMAIGLKMFSEVALHHRTDPLFEPIMLPIREFIGRLKALPSKEESA